MIGLMGATLSLNLREVDWSRPSFAVVVVALGIATTLIAARVVHKSVQVFAVRPTLTQASQQRKQPQPQQQRDTANSNNSNDNADDNEGQNIRREADTLRVRAKEAAEARQHAWEKKQKTMKLVRQQHQQKAKLATIATQKPATNKAVVVENKTSLQCVFIGSSSDATDGGAEFDSVVAASMPVFDDGMTSFRHIPSLPDADEAAALLRQLARDFVPILRQRGHDVVTVSEFCCCGDGLDYQLGGRAWTVRPGTTRIAGHEAANVAGYNRLHNNNERTRRNAKASASSCSIHLRLRSPDNHNDLRTSYQELCEHMAHEVAHCVYRHHGPEFHQLMRDVQEQHEAIRLLEALTASDDVH